MLGDDREVHGAALAEIYGEFRLLEIVRLTETLWDATEEYLLRTTGRCTHSSHHPSFGNGRELNDDEIDLLLGAFLTTREGLHYEAGDILLCDNIRYGHSREAFTPPRTLGVALARTVSLEHLR